jgi:hypothetical protein
MDGAPTVRLILVVVEAALTECGVPALMLPTNSFDAGVNVATSVLVPAVDEARLHVAVRGFDVPVSAAVQLLTPSLMVTEPVTKAKPVGVR